MLEIDFLSIKVRFRFRVEDYDGVRVFNFVLGILIYGRIFKVVLFFCFLIFVGWSNKCIIFRMIKIKL